MGDCSGTVGIIGSGTMGSGIAQVAAVSGWHAMLMDTEEAIVRRARTGIGRRLDRLVEKGKLAADQRAAAMGRLHAVSSPSGLADCTLVVEAVVEDHDAKVTVLRGTLAAIRRDCVVATNTSSLSVGRIGAEIGEPQRVAGMHFFNPVPLMKLVEVVSGPDTATATAARVADAAASWGKTVVHCRDTPGFIVNRVARGYYVESLRILGEGIASIDEIDGVMKRVGLFRMGPFELMDLVGIDVNDTVSRSVYERLGRPARLRPHPIQADLYERNQLGRKTGRGFYSYDGTEPVPVVTTNRHHLELPPNVREPVHAFCSGASNEAGTSTEQYVFARVLASIINEAVIAVDEGVASQDDIDAAMKTGTNYPKGPLQWARDIGVGTCRRCLTALNASCDDNRFEPAGGLLGGSHGSPST